MKRNDEGPIAEVVSVRSSLLEIFIVAIFIAVGVNLVAGGFLATFRPRTALICGTGLCALALAYLVWTIQRQQRREETYHGFLVYNRETNELLLVPRYDLANEVAQHLRAAFAENEALQKIWREDPIGGGFDLDHEKGTYRSRQSRSNVLIREALEYFFLDRLALHLEAYFNVRDLSEAKVEKLERNDIPQVILENRFLELFSRAMADRPHFVDDALRNDTDRVYDVWSPDGPIYSRFELVVPKGSRITRTESGALRLSTSRFSITVKPSFAGFATVLPDRFAEVYLAEDCMNLVFFDVDFQVRVDLGFASLLTGSDWDYYSWLDSFLSELRGQVSAEAFFGKIGWESHLTLVQHMESQKTQ